MQRIFVILTLLAAFAANARTIDEGRASRIASQFMLSKGNSSSLSPVTLKNSPLSRSFLEAAPVYIYNMSDGGFVIVAGDDRACPVLAYSNEANLNVENLPQPFVEWLRQYTAEIESLGESSAADGQSATYAFPSTVIAPLLKTSWDQGDPFNRSCPTDNATKKKSLTGCVATATAQIMNYHRYPTRGTGVVSYYDSSQKVNMLLNFATRPEIEWDKMLDRYYSDSPQENINAVSEFMMQVGYACRMNYSSGTSIAIHRNTYDALVDNFGYDSNIHRYERKFISAGDWVELLVAELSAGRPILYDGRSSQSGGHSFVCDGYDGNGMFHFNWGWGGLADGYFALSALNPESHAGVQDYTGEQAIECNIMPPGSGAVRQTKHLLGIDKLYGYDNSGTLIDYNPLSSFEGNTLYSGFAFHCWNIGHQDFEGEIAIVARVDGKNVTVTSTRTAIPGANYKWTTLAVSPGILPDGAHRVGFAYRFFDEEEWHQIRGKYDEPYEALLTVRGDKIVYGNESSSIVVPGVDADELSVTVSGGVLLVKSSSPLSHVKLTSVNGMQAAFCSDCGTEASIDVSSIAGGVYIIEAVTESRNLVVRKVII